jgi:putative addiction module CopG family antidote
MPNPKTLNISLPQDLQDLVEAKVASGEYANESDVVAEGLRKIADHDRVYEKWLIDEVVPTLRAHDADPSRAISVDEMRRRMQAHINARKLEKTAS